MKLCKSWLDDWIETRLDAQVISDRLTMAGLEVDSVESISVKLQKLVVGKIIDVQPHPNADKLSVCIVDVGKSRPLQIVCGAKNVASGDKGVVALPGSVIANGKKIAIAEVRGIKSSGMLCSAAELGMEETSEGILQLEQKFKPGSDVIDLLKLDDYTIDIDLTPNRGDCLSVRGIARELSALTGKKIKPQKWKKIRTNSPRTIKLNLVAKNACPRYIGRIIEGIDPNAKTPLWMTERLRRSGLRAIHPVVDVTNYVMLEFGQPMHGFDLAKLSGSISVRLSKKGESMNLLDGQQITLEEETLLICDRNGPVALAGIMGGLESAVDEHTTDVFLESAFFSPAAVAGRARDLGLHTDSSHRFERGVDPERQAEAMEYASYLLTSIAGGKAGKLNQAEAKEKLPSRPTILLNRQQVTELLGVEITSSKIESYLKKLGLNVTTGKNGQWRVKIPGFRFDLERSVDLIEEIARLYGYENLPVSQIDGAASMQPVSDGIVKESRLKTLLTDRDYLEVVTYSFTDPQLQSLVVPGANAPKLQNPLSEDLAIMRASLWPGLLSTATYNLNRQQQRIRIFELGACFATDNHKRYTEQTLLSGLVTGSALPEQWGEASREVDFFDLKGDVECLYRLVGLNQVISFKPTENPALHPGQGADIWLDDEKIGCLGRIHPQLADKLAIEIPLYLFELQFLPLKEQNVPKFEPLSRFPAIRRDIAVVVDRDLPAEKIMKCARMAAGDLLVDLELFDEYRGEGIDSGRKSLALGLILQDSSRTLKEEAVESLLHKVVDVLNKELGAELRT